MDSFQNVEHVAESDDTYLLTQQLLEYSLLNQDLLQEWVDVLIVLVVVTTEIQLDVFLN